MRHPTRKSSRMRDMSQIQITPISGALGAEVTGVDLGAPL
ncbi:MAG: hypothetical protein ACI9OF_002258, partial [Saprospiraceae bacterium]